MKTMSNIKRQDSIIYYDDEHRYVDEDTGEEFESVTRFIHRFEQEFDSDKHSARVAKRDGKTQEQVLQEWKDKADVACDYGTDIHWFMEQMFLAPGRIIIPKNEDERKLLEAYHKTKQLELNGDVYPEQIIYNKTYKIAGQSDLIHVVPNNQFDVGDWKTNEKFKYYSPYNQYLKHPLSHLSQCEYNTYCLQLSLYAYFYELMTGMKCRKVFILYYWRTHNIFQVIPMNYMKLEVMMMLKYYTEKIINNKL